MTPKISIIIATYNRAHFIVATLESIQNQTFKEWECLIIDDGGSDNTQQVISEILEKDNRFHLYQRPNQYKKGLSGSRNYGLDLARGDYFIFFDDDDFVHPDNLKISIEMIIGTNVDFCHYQKESYQIEKPIISEALVTKVQFLTKKDIAKIITQEIGMASCTVLWDRKCFEQIRFNESLLYAEEWECYSKIISKGFKGVVIDTVLYYNKKHALSNTGEFYRNNPIRRESKKNAILLVVQNLKKQQLLSDSLMRYFTQIALHFKEYQLFDEMINCLDLGKALKLKWKMFYFVLPYRLVLYGVYKKIKKKY